MKKDILEVVSDIILETPDEEINEEIKNNPSLAKEIEAAKQATEDAIDRAKQIPLGLFLARVNKVTSNFRHGRSISEKDLVALSNSQIEMEKSQKLMIKDLEHLNKVLETWDIKKGSHCHEIIKRTLNKLN